jgi:hypothetical protein
MRVSLGACAPPEEEAPPAPPARPSDGGRLLAACDFQSAPAQSTAQRAA